MAQNLHILVPVLREVVSHMMTLRGRVPEGTGVTALERSDLATVNQWFIITRVRTALIVALAMPLLAWGTGLDLPILTVAAICGCTAATTPFLRRRLARGGDLLGLAYTQQLIDTIAITAGLAAMGAGGLLFGYFYLMTIVPAAMVSGRCVAFVTLLDLACWALLLAMSPLDAVRNASTSALLTAPGFIFAIVANQCFFYKQHLRDKNRTLAASSDSLVSTNADLASAVETARGLSEVGRALGTSLDMGILVGRLHTVATELLKTDWCATLLLDATSPAGYRLLASRGLGASAQVPVTAAFWEFGALVAADEVVELPDATVAPAPRAIRGWPVSSALFTTLRCGNRSAGIFATGYRERTGAFTPAQRELAIGIAAQAAVAIENSTLHARQREEGEISAALLEVAELLNASLESESALDRLAALVCRLTGLDFANVVLFDEEKETVRIVAGVDVDMPDVLAESRAVDFDLREFPILLRAVERGFAEVDRAGDLLKAEWMRLWDLAAAYAVPLVLRGEAIGALVVGSHHHARKAEPKLRRLLTGIAHQAVTAIENGRLVQNLRAANGLKSEFIGTMSHELRTPLNAIIGYNELLSEGEFGAVTDEQRVICGKVLAYSRQLLELIQATLDVSRMETGALPVTLAPVDVGALLDELAGQIPDGWVKPGVRLVFAERSVLPRIDSDYPKLKMVVRNLVHNALKFTDAGSVTVDAGVADDGALVITVTDTGVGISDEAQAIIFEMFRQVDGSDRRRHDGVGLGLYIVRRLTMLLGGTVAVQSAVGRGSRFEVRLPCASTARPAVSLSA